MLHVTPVAFGCGAVTQLVLQLPHAVAVLVRSVSQPLASIESQLPKPASHIPIAHEPLEQVAVALARLHGVPQVPQFDVVVSDVSQPSGLDILQLPQPASQVVSVQLPLAHDSEALGSAQETPHAPQSLVVVVERSQPSAGIPLQSAQPASQAAIAQPPETHISTACGRLHAMPQPPQLFTSLERLTSQPSE